LAVTELDAYFDSNVLGLSDYEIVEVLSLNQLEVNDILETPFKEENLIDYLYEHIDDLEELNLDDYE